MRVFTSEDIQESQREYYWIYPHSTKIIVFIHGILEGANQFRQLAKMGYCEGYSVYILLLPGHGKSSKAFANSNLYEWVEYVNNTLKVLEKQYDEIILVGHSMGSLLAIGYAVVRPGAIKAIVTLAIPLRVRVLPRVIKSALAIRWRPVKETERYTMAECRAMGIRADSVQTPIEWVPRYMDLFVLMFYIERRLASVKCPVLVIQSQKDEFVAPDTMLILSKQLVHKQIICLKDSGHFCYNHTDLSILQTAFKQFIKRYSK